MSPKQGGLLKPKKEKKKNREKITGVVSKIWIMRSDVGNLAKIFFDIKYLILSPQIFDMIILF